MRTIKDESDYGLFDWWKKVIKYNFANFKGRARRSEYWFFLLANLLVFILIITIGAFIITLMELEQYFPVIGAIVSIYSLLIFIPAVAVSVRRLHDIGKSGWFILLNFIPLGSIVLLIFYLQDSDIRENKWGANPK